MSVVNFKYYKELKDYRDEVRNEIRFKLLGYFLELHVEIKEETLTELKAEKGMILINYLIKTSKTNSMNLLCTDYKNRLERYLKRK